MNYKIIPYDYKKKTQLPHTHNEYEIIFYTTGKGTFHTPKKNHPIKTGRIVVIPPGFIHYTTTDSELQCLVLRGSMPLLSNISSVKILTDNERHEVEFLMRMIYENRSGNTEYLSALRNALFHFILKSLKTASNIGLAVNKIISDIVNNFQDSSISLNLLLGKSNYAEDYIRAQFKKIVGKTPTAFLNNIRIQYACDLIEEYKDSLSLSEISEKCGYTDYVCFSKKFKQLTGMSPRTYKNK